MQYAYLDGDGYEDQIGTNTGYGDFCRWVDGLAGLAQLKRLVDEGEHQQPLAVRAQLQKALQSSPPDASALAVAHGLLVVLSHADDDTAIVTIYNGVVKDPDADPLPDADETEEEDDGDEDEDNDPVDPPGPKGKSAPMPVLRTADERAGVWQRHMDQRKPATKAMQRVVNSALFRARAQVLRNLEATGRKALNAAAAGIVQRDDDKENGQPRVPHPGRALDVMFDPKAFTIDLTTVTQKVGRETLQTAGVELRAELGVEDPWVMESGDVFNALASRANLIAGASDEVFQEVLDDLGKGIEGGETTAQLAERVRAKFQDMSKGRSETIAQTETGALYGVGRNAGAISVGAKTKTWLSSRDNKVRDTHKAADGQSVAIDGLFRVGADTMPSPCNGGLASENVCCRCVALFHVP